MIPKFRAWDKEIKMMIEISLIDFEMHVIRGTHWKFGETESIKFNDIELMQSTGLKDKNGKEIFEGDILEVDDCGEVLGNAKLIWDNEQAAFMIDAISVDDIAPFYEFVSDEDYFYRVIGNIYENPELLEDKE